MPRPASLAARILLGLVLPITLLACSAGSSPSLPPSPSPAPSASPAPGSGAVVVTLRVSGETYRVRLTDPADIAIARDLLAGKSGPRIPNGKVVRGAADVNAGWSWHIDPGDFAWADVTIELCDGRPSFVERDEISGDRFCPWSAEVTSVDPLP